MSKQEENNEVLKSSLDTYDRFWYKYPSIEEFVYTNIRKFSPHNPQDEQLGYMVFSKICEAYNLLLECFKVLPVLFTGNELAIKEGQLAAKAKNMKKAYDDMKKYVYVNDSGLEDFPAPRKVENPEITYGDATSAYLSSLSEGEEPTFKGLLESVANSPKPYNGGTNADQEETYYIDQFFGEERQHRF